MAYRGAVSIAGRLVDPLREMVKVPPSALGLGMYQHDQKEAVLSRRLGEVLQEIVSECGVDLNMASEEVMWNVSPADVSLSLSASVAFLSLPIWEPLFRCFVTCRDCSAAGRRPLSLTVSSLGASGCEHSL